MAKYIIILIIILLDSIIIEAQDIKKIVIRYVDYEIESFVPANCMDFEAWFEKDVRQIQITNAKEIKKLNNLLYSLEPYTENTHPDVRLKITQFMNVGSKTYCMDDFRIEDDKRTYKVSKKLLNYIEHLKKKYRWGKRSKYNFKNGK